MEFIGINADKLADPWTRIKGEHSEIFLFFTGFSGVDHGFFS